MEDKRENLVRFVVRGEPYGKGRPKFSARGGFARAITPEKTVSYETLVKLEFHQQCGEVFFQKKDAIALWVYAYKPIPSGTSKKRTAMMLENEIRPGKKPDWDNIGKIVSDALNEVAFADDAQVVDGRVIKRYSDIPRVEVEIWRVGING